MALGVGREGLGLGFEVLKLGFKVLRFLESIWAFSSFLGLCLRPPQPSELDVGLPDASCDPCGRSLRFWSP